MGLFLSRRVAFVQSQKDLHEDLPDDIFRHEVFLSSALLDQLCHVSIFTVLHDDVELVLFFQDYPSFHENIKE